MSEFTIVEWRKLGEALEQNERFGGNDQIILAAARRDYDRYQECGNPSCDGGFFTDRWAASEREWLEGTHERPCPSCGGSGLKPNQAFQEKVTYALHHAAAGKPFDPLWVGAELVRAFDKEEQ